MATRPKHHRSGPPPDIMRKGHTHPRRRFQPTIDWDEVDEALEDTWRKRKHDYQEDKDYEQTY